MIVKLDPKKIEHYYEINGTQRKLRHYHLLSGDNVFIDMKRNKKCECGVLVYWSVGEDDKIRKIHRTVNSFCEHVCV